MDNTEKLLALSKQARQLDMAYAPEFEKYVNAMLDDLNEQEWFPIAFLEEMLKIQKNRLAAIVEKQIPEIMFEMNMKSISLNDGTVISVEDTFNVSQKPFETDEENQAAKSRLIDWLNSHGYGGIIKGKYFLEEKAVTDELAERLEAEGVHLFRDSEVNTASLKKLLKEHMEPKFDPDLGFEINGELPPPDAVKISIFKKAKIVCKTKK